MQLNWKQTMPIWWSFTWRGLFYGLLLGMALGFFAGLYAGVSGVPDKGFTYGVYAGWVATVPASMLPLEHALSKHLVALRAAADVPATGS